MTEYADTINERIMHDRIDELERQIAEARKAAEWTLIDAEHLPKVGEEIVRGYAPEYIANKKAWFHDRLTAAPEPTKQERVTVTRMGASEHVFVEFDGKIIYQFDDHEDEENDAEFHAKRYAAGLRQELEETK